MAKPMTSGIKLGVVRPGDEIIVVVTPGVISDQIVLELRNPRYYGDAVEITGLPNRKSVWEFLKEISELTDRKVEVRTEDVTVAFKDSLPYAHRF